MRSFSAYEAPFTFTHCRLVSHRLRQGRKLTALNHKLIVLDVVVVFVKASRRRARRVRSVLVKGSAMTRAHEQVRLLEPANRAAEMRAVNGEDLKLLPLDSPHPARDISGHPIPWPRVRIAVGRKPRLTHREAFQRAE